MHDRCRFLALAYLILAATIGIAIALDNNETDIAADEVILMDDESIDYNDTDVDLRSHYKRLRIKYPPPIENYRTPPSDPCGTPFVECLCPGSPYRTLDGTCNNLIFPARGSARSAFSRLQKGRYADANGKVITRTENGKLPLPRVLSSNLFKSKDVPEIRATTAVIAWGQMIAHDGSFIEEVSIEDGRPVRCCRNGQIIRNGPRSCLPIKIPQDDPFYSKFYVGCLEMRRTVTLNTTGCAYPEVNQISATSHFIDASHVYGNSEDEVNKLRSFRKGKLRTKVLRRKGGKKDIFMPQDENPKQSCFVSKNSDPCYKSGDFRVNQNLGLAVFHTILLREHNRIAKILHKMHPEWNDETLFQEARRINIAQFQHITYHEFVPVVIGKLLTKKLALATPKTGFLDFYDPENDCSTMSEFSASAFRSLHGLVPEYNELTDEKRCPFKEVPLKDVYNIPGIIEKKKYMEAFSRGFASQPSQTGDNKFSESVTQYLLKLPKYPFGLDLESFDIQRGRDQGIPTYNEMRRYCGLPRARRFSDLSDVIPEKYIQRLKEFYKSVDDIDFFVGAVHEKRGVLGDERALIGHTFGCVIGEQFWRWKFGDRYFYDLGGQAGSFTLDQINGIKKTSLAALLCENLHLEYIQPNPFLQVSKRNELVRCSDIERMDLSGFLYYTPIDSCGQPPS